MKELSVVFGTELRDIVYDAYCNIQVHRSETRGSKIMCSDGSKKGDMIGWAAILVDAEGVVVSAAGSAVCVSGSSWSAEWCWKYLAIELLEQVDWRGRSIMGAIADNAAAVFGYSGGSSSSCIWIHRLRLAYAEFIHAHGVDEFFVPAQHDSHATHEVAMWQKKCDDLPKEAAHQAQASSIPFRSLLSDCAFLFWEGKLVMDAPKTMDAGYMAAQGFNVPQGMSAAGRTWQETVIKHNLTQGALKYAFGARTAPWCHVAESPDFFCLFCRSERRSWGGHITTKCFISSVASFLGLIAAAEFLHGEGWSMDWVDIQSVRFDKKEKPGVSA